MFLCGMMVGGGIVGLIAIAVLWRDAKKTETAHERYLREYQRAECGWRNNPRSMRHRHKRLLVWKWMRARDEAPLPMDWGDAR